MQFWGTQQSEFTTRSQRVWWLVGSQTRRQMGNMKFPGRCSPLLANKYARPVVKTHPQKKQKKRCSSSFL
jgi:hypothetical protein